MKFFAGLIFALQINLYAQNNAAVWYTDFDTVIQIAQRENRPILMVFSGSDWCKPCIKLQKEVFDQRVFEEYAAQNLVLLKLDFPRYKKNRLPDSLQIHHESLAEKFNPEGGFPFICLLNSEGTVITQTQFPTIQPEDFVRYLSNLISSR
ncbi:MAG: thioredoxin family protein [Bacteroidia bacterium]|nr:thioredoxin family protein [Bacteroidia bacterium]